MQTMRSKKNEKEFLAAFKTATTTSRTFAPRFEPLLFIYSSSQVSSQKIQEKKIVETLTIESPGHEHLDHKEDEDRGDVILDGHY